MLDLYAVGIDDVRDIFGADEQLAAELTAAAQEAFPPQAPRRRQGFLPLRRRGPEFTVDPSRPTADDLSILLSGGYVAPERMLASWRLFHALLQHRSAAHVRVEIDDERLDDVEFDLARHGLDTFYSLRRLGERQLGIPLRGLEGAIAGYAKQVHVVETSRALRAVRDEVGPDTRATVDEFLSACDAVATDSSLDLVVLQS